MCISILVAREWSASSIRKTAVVGKQGARILDSSPGLESKHDATQIAHAPEFALRPREGGGSWWVAP